MDRIGLHHLRIYNANYEISTVALPDGGYETLVWEPKTGDELDMRRYYTEQEAARGHVEMMRKWEATAYEGSIDKALGFADVGQFVRSVVCPKVAI